jgi:3-oxoacyl-[acyl-carrier-protein] synthase II
VSIVIQGIGVVGGFGCGVGEFARALDAGISRPQTLPVSVGPVPFTIPAFRADTSPLDQFVPARTLRRVEAFSKLGLLGSYLALADAGMSDMDRGRLGVVVATGYGPTGNAFAHLDSFVDGGDICSSPTHFANSVHNSAAANISILLGAAGPNLTVSQFGMSVPSALLTARQWLVEGRVDHVLFGAMDELSDLLGYAWNRLKGGVTSSAMTPLRMSAETAIPGEGAAFLLLSSAEAARGGYAAVRALDTGASQRERRVRPSSELQVIAADGHPETGERYAVEAARGPFACYSPLYGSLPAGPAFDLAAAALVLQRGWVFPTPGADLCDVPGLAAATPGPFDGATIDCLTLSADGGHGVVTLGRC